MHIYTHPQIFPLAAVLLFLFVLVHMATAAPVFYTCLPDSTGLCYSPQLRSRPILNPNLGLGVVEHSIVTVTHHHIYTRTFFHIPVRICTSIPTNNRPCIRSSLETRNDTSHRAQTFYHIRVFIFHHTHRKSCKVFYSCSILPQNLHLLLRVPRHA